MYVNKALARNNWKRHYVITNCKESLKLVKKFNSVISTNGLLLFTRKRLELVAQYYIQNDFFSKKKYLEN